MRNHEAANVRAEMARLGRTQRELAVVLGVSQPTVSARLAGRRDFTVAELRTVAKWLGVPLRALIAEEAA